MRRALAPLDEADTFVWAAIRAYADEGQAPAPPESPEWSVRAHRAGVLNTVISVTASAGHFLPDECRVFRTKTAVRQMRIARDLEILVAALDDLDIPWALLKGPVLADVVFRSRGVREYADLDILVSPSRVDAAVHALVAAGATLRDIDWAHVNRARTAEIGLLLPHGTVLDLHWNLVNIGRTRDAYRLPTDRLLARRVVRTTPATSFPTLDDLDLVVHVALHACLSGGHQLRWLLDVQQCLQWLGADGRGASTQDLARRAESLGAGPALRAVTRSVADHLDPSAAPWELALTGVAPWNTVLRTMSRRSPPSSPSISPRTARTWHAATRPTSGASAAALVRTAWLSVRYRRSGWPAGTPLPAALTDPGYREWVRVAELEAGDGLLGR